jgi:hypothetical protein
LSHCSAGPITGCSCQPRAMTCPRTDSAAPPSAWRITVACWSLARRRRKWTQPRRGRPGGARRRPRPPPAYGRGCAYVLACAAALARRSGAHSAAARDRAGRPSARAPARGVLLRISPLFSTAGQPTIKWV